MSFSVRDGFFDVAIVAGPRVSIWPSPGVYAISSICAEAGLRVGVLGGETIKAKGVLPMSPTGGIVLAEDIQHRIHRIQARAIVRVSLPSCMPDPFNGWRSSGLIPLSTARRLKKESLVSWAPASAILGTGNKAFRFGYALLDEGVPNVYCIETFAQWGAKRYSGWEVERRRFEMAGGVVIEARPLLLREKAPLLWELQINEGDRVRSLDVARVVSAGPFAPQWGLKEYPPGSLLFELDQSAYEKLEDDPEGWTLEEERGRLLACGLVRALASGLDGESREKVLQLQKRAKARLKRFFKHRDEPFIPAYQGKLIGKNDAAVIRSAPGVPKARHARMAIASVECIESIGCTICQQACPNGGIAFSKTRDQILSEEHCHGCGACVAACPSGSIVLVNEKEGASIAEVTMRWSGHYRWSQSEFASLLNRKGEVLASARVLEVLETERGCQLVKVAVPIHLLWEARSLRKKVGELGVQEPDSLFVRADKIGSQRVEIQLDGEKRLVRDRIPVSIALFEIGQSRKEDVLLCPDGSCGLCDVVIDGVKRPACKTDVHRGMSLKLKSSSASRVAEDKDICSCLGTTSAQIEESVKHGNLQSMEGVVSSSHFAEGRCHGQICADPFKRCLNELGIDAEQWIDWRFPWSDWRLNPAPKE